MCALTKQCQNGSTRPSSSGLFFALSNSGQHRNTASVILTLALMLAGFRLHALSGKDKKTKTEPSQRQCSQRQREERKIATTVLIQCGKEELTSAVPRHRTSHCFGSNLALGAKLSNRTFLQAPPITKNVKVHKSSANTKIPCRYSSASSSSSYSSDIIQTTLRPRVFLHYNNSRIRVFHSFGNYLTTLMHRKRAQRKKQTKSWQKTKEQPSCPPKHKTSKQIETKPKKQKQSLVVFVEDRAKEITNNNDSTNFLQLAIKPQRQAPSFIPSAAFNSHETATATTTASSSFQ